MYYYKFRGDKVYIFSMIYVLYNWWYSVIEGICIEYMYWEKENLIYLIKISNIEFGKKIKDYVFECRVLIDYIMRVFSVIIIK